MQATTKPATPDFFDPLAAEAERLQLMHRVPFVRVVRDFLDADACAALKARIGAYGPQAAPVTTMHGAVMRPELRNNDRVMFDDVDLAASLFERARRWLPSTLRGDDGPRTTTQHGATWQAVGLNERFRGYRYRPGQRFAPHFDGCFARTDDETSALTFLVYLDDGCTGGETNVLDWGVQVRPATGTLFLFDHYVLHEGAVVTAGEKNVLRSDVMYRRIIVGA